MPPRSRAVVLSLLVVVGVGLGAHAPVAAAPVQGDAITFAPATPYASQPGGNATVAVDVDQDGDVDIVLTGGQRTELFANRGDGTFDAAVGIARVPGRALAAGDLDGDGYPDLVIAQTIGRTAVLLNRGDGTFGPRTVYDPSGTPRLADLDADGDLDLVVNSGTSGIRLLFGDGTGALDEQPPLTAGGRSFIQVLPVDLDGDADPDLAAVTSGPFFTPAALRTYANDGGGGFTAVASRRIGLTSVLDLAAGDADGDGDADIAAVGGNGGVLIAGDGALGIVAVTRLPLSGAPDSVLAADLDADGRLDLAVGNDAGIPVAVAGTGNGGFAAGVAFAPAGGGVSGADYDADGDLDLAAVHGGRLYVAANTSTA